MKVRQPSPRSMPGGSPAAWITVEHVFAVPSDLHPASAPRSIDAW